MVRVEEAVTVRKGGRLDVSRIKATLTHHVSCAFLIPMEPPILAPLTGEEIGTERPGDLPSTTQPESRTRGQPAQQWPAQGPPVGPASQLQPGPSLKSLLPCEGRGL